jgi:hypothetical protein
MAVEHHRLVSFRDVFKAIGGKKTRVFHTTSAMLRDGALARDGDGLVRRGARARLP